MQGYQVRRALARGVTIPASQTAAPVTTQNISDNMRTNLVIDIYLGQVASTPSLLLQDSTGYGIWNTVKSASASASTDKTVSAVAPTTGTLTIASHGYMNGQLVAINSSSRVPGGLDSQLPYYVANATTNTFQLAPVGPTNGVNPISNSMSQSAFGSFIDAGAGTITISAVQVLTIRANVEVAGDQSVMPIRPLGRIACTTSGSQTCQVLLVNSGYVY